MSRLLENAINELSKLPGVGRRTALRLALHILRQKAPDVDLLTAALAQFRHNVRYCSVCNNLSDSEICPICDDKTRGDATVCVVEHVGDLITIESTGQYTGRYHVLGGVISPIAGVAPSDLDIPKLVKRIVERGISEVILALPTTMEGETTAFYLSKKLSNLGISVTAISRGIGFGDEIEYADALTITHAIKHRKPVL